MAIRSHGRRRFNDSDVKLIGQLTKHIGIVQQSEVMRVIQASAEGRDLIDRLNSEIEQDADGQKIERILADKVRGIRKKDSYKRKCK